MAWMLHHTTLSILTFHIIYLLLVPVGAAESRECREQEYKDQSGNCKTCKQCDAGQELSKECGFGYGVDARCVPCRRTRFKEERGLQKCKPCLDCVLLNRLQKTNCSATSNAMCGDCLPGYYRKTKLSGFQDMECIPCGDPPPPYEPHCSGRVNLVPLPSMATSPRDMALAAVICSALATVLLALLVLCVIYCKRQLLEKKPGASVRLQDGPYSGAELSCLDRRWLHDFPDTPYCQCRLGPGHTCGPVHLIPSLCWDESCSLGRDSRDNVPFHSQMSLSDGNLNQDEGDPVTHAGPEPGPKSASGESRRESSESLETPQCVPGVAAREEAKAEECCEMTEEEYSGPNEDVQARSPDCTLQSSSKTWVEVNSTLEG